MSIDISRKVLSQIETETLLLLKSLESQLVDFFEYEDKKLLPGINSTLIEVGNVFFALQEDNASKICYNLAIIFQHEDMKYYDTQKDVITSVFLSLMSYLESQDRESQSSLVYAMSLFDNQDTKVVVNDDKLKEEAGKLVTDLVKAEIKEDFWQIIYKVTKSMCDSVTTKEIYDYFWQLEAFAFQGIKQNFSLQAEQKKIIVKGLSGVCDAVAKFGEVPDLLTIIDKQDTVINSIVKVLPKAKVKLGYNPPINRLVIFDDEISMVLPISSKTYESIAFDLKKNVTYIKDVLIDAYSTELTPENRDSVITSVNSIASVFYLFNFKSGCAICERLVSLLQVENFSYDEVSEYVVLLEDALWQIYYRDKEIVSDIISFQRETFLTALLALSKEKIIEVSYLLVKTAREETIVKSNDVKKLNLTNIAYSLHEVFGAFTLLEDVEFASFVHKTEKMTLVLGSTNALAKDHKLLSLYIEALVCCEVVLEFYNHSLYLDKKALEIYMNALTALGNAIGFVESQVPEADYVTKASEREITDAEYREVVKDNIADFEDSEPEQEEEDLSGNYTEFFDSADDINIEELRLISGVYRNNTISSIDYNDLDDEMVEIFLEESVDIHEMLCESLPKLLDNPHNDTIIGDVRRGYHTLKGSGRMVGLKVFGEFAWHHENLLNAVIAGNFSLTKNTIELLIDSNKIIESTINSDPFAEDKDLLLNRAALLEAVRDKLLGNGPKAFGDGASSTKVVKSHIEVGGSDSHNNKQSKSPSQAINSVISGLSSLENHPALDVGASVVAEAKSSGNNSLLGNELDFAGESGDKSTFANSANESINGKKSSSIESLLGDGLDFDEDISKLATQSSTNKTSSGKNNSIADMIEDLAASLSKFDNKKSALNSDLLSSINKLVEETKSDSISDNQLATVLSAVSKAMTSLTKDNADKEKQSAIDNIEQLTSSIKDLGASSKLSDKEPAPSNSTGDNSAGKLNAKLKKAIDNYKEAVSAPQSYDEILDCIYDIEDNLGSDTPSWTWEALSSLESPLLSMKGKKNLDHNNQGKLIEAIDYLASSLDFDEKSANKFKNDFLQLRAELMKDDSPTKIEDSESLLNFDKWGDTGFDSQKTDKDTLSEISSRSFVNKSAVDVDKSVDSYQKWHNDDYNPTQHLSNLSEHVDRIKDSAHSAGYSDVYDVVGPVSGKLSSLIDNAEQADSYTGSIVGEVLVDIKNAKDDILKGKSASIKSKPDSISKALGFDTNGNRIDMDNVANSDDELVANNNVELSNAIYSDVDSDYNLGADFEAGLVDISSSSPKESTSLDSDKLIEAKVDKDNVSSMPSGLDANISGLDFADEYQSELISKTVNITGINKGTNQLQESSGLGADGGFRVIAPVYQSAFVSEAKEDIDDLLRSFKKWESKDFLPGKALESLSEDIKNIESKAQTVGYDDAYNLAKPVGEKLEELQIDNAQADEITSQVVKEAVDDLVSVKANIESGIEANISAERIQYVTRILASVSSSIGKHSANVENTGSGAISGLEFVSSPSHSAGAINSGSVLAETSLHTGSPTAYSDAAIDFSSIPTSNLEEHELSTSSPMTMTAGARTVAKTDSVINGLTDGAKAIEASFEPHYSDIKNDDGLLDNFDGFDSEALQHANAKEHSEKYSDKYSDKSDSSSLSPDGAGDSSSDTASLAFANKSAVEVDKSVDSYQKWQKDEYKPTQNLEDLHEHVGRIKDSAYSSGYSDVYDVVGPVSGKLSALKDNFEQADSHTGALIGEILADIKKAKDNILKGKLASIGKDRAAAISKALGFDADGNNINYDSVDSSSEALQHDSADEYTDKLDSSGINSDGENLSVASSRAFANKSAVEVDKSVDSYQKWQDDEYMPTQHLDNLSDHVDSIKDSAHSSGYSDVYDVVGPVSGKLSALKDNFEQADSHTGGIVGEVLTDIKKAKDNILKGKMSSIDKDKAAFVSKALGFDADGKSIDSIGSSPETLQYSDVGEYSDKHVDESDSSGINSVGDGDMGRNNLKNTVPKYQSSFVDKASEVIDDSLADFASWESKGFLPGNNLNNLANSINDIKENAFDAGYEELYNLVKPVAQKLEDLKHNNAKADEFTSEAIRETIADIVAAKSAINAGQQAKIAEDKIDYVAKVMSMDIDAGADVKTEAEGGIDKTNELLDKTDKLSENIKGDLSSTAAHDIMTSPEVVTKIDEYSMDKADTALNDANVLDNSKTLSPNIISSDNHQSDLVKNVAAKIDESMASFENWENNSFSDDNLNTLNEHVDAVKGMAEELGYADLSKILNPVLSTLDSLKHSGAIPDENALSAIGTALKEAKVAKESIMKNEDVVINDDVIDYVNNTLNTYATDSGSTTNDVSITNSSTDYKNLEQNDTSLLNETILDIFLDEAKQIIEKNIKNLAGWYDNFTDLVALNEMQRNMHTLKGGSRMAALTVLGDLVHNVEHLLDLIADGKIKNNERAHELLNKCNNIVSDYVNIALVDGVIYEDTKYLDSLSSFITEETGIAPKRESANKIKAIGAKSNTNVVVGHKEVKKFSIRLDNELVEKINSLIGEDSVLRSRLERNMLIYRSNIEELSKSGEKISEQLRRLNSATETQILFRRENTQDKDFDPLELDQFSEIQQFSRSLSESVDDLLNISTVMYDSIALSRNLFLEQRRVHHDLQSYIMSAKMVKFETISERIKRLITQVSEELGKDVELFVYGGQTDVERSLFEDLLPGFEHAIRNSIAHGIEMPEERKKKGKPEKGQIRIGAHREGTDIWFVIADDGRGVDYKKIKAKAKTMGVFDESKGDDKNYLLGLLFEKGLSTSDKMTQVSGRGIGMDVLKNAVMSRSGVIDIETEINKGLAISIKVPFKTSVTDALLVRVGKFKYVIPVMSIDGISRINLNDYHRFKEGEEIVLTYGQNKYQLASLSLFTDNEAELSFSAFGVPIILSRIGNKRIALEVEEIVGRQEIIIKSVSSQLINLPGIIGATVLEDGEAVPVLDISSLDSVLDRMLSIRTGDDKFIAEDITEEDKEIKILIVDDSITMRKATTKILSRYKTILETAKDGVNAIEKITDFMPDVILLDIEMPRMDGFEFASYVRSKEEFADVKIIMITSRTGSKHRDRAEQIGVNDYLGKPYSEEVLIDAIANVLDRKVSKLD